MSFRLFIYYCALLGGAAAFCGWAVGRSQSMPDHKIMEQGVKALWLGLLVAFALALVDSLAGFSLRRLLAVLMRVLTATLGGALAGLIGGMASQSLFTLASHPIFLVLGWAVTGLLIGAALGLFDVMVCAVRGQEAGGALRKVRNGAIGGVAGGSLGGILSVLLRGWLTSYFQVQDERLWSPAAWGFVALGVSIGFLIGLAQVILKEAWLRVERGFRVGRQLILSRPETTIGRAEACDLGLFGDPTVGRLHARILRERGRHILEDLGSPGGTYVNDLRIEGRKELKGGDLIRMGQNVVRYEERSKEKA